MFHLHIQVPKGAKVRKKTCSQLHLIYIPFLGYLCTKYPIMTEIENLDRIAIDVRSHKLLKQLLSENPEFEEILRNNYMFDVH